jgi:hypothetical protein
MFFRIGADLVVIVHFAFIAFIILGGLLVLRWPRIGWAHVPCAIYGVLIEWVGWVCPLTPLENMLRDRAGQNGYAEGFVEHYLIPIIYPSGLTHEVQMALGAFVLVTNVAVYAVVVWRAKRGGDDEREG